MQITLFPTLSGTVVQRHDIEYETLVSACQNPPIYPTKQDCPLIKLASVGEKRSSRGSLRFDANIASVSGCECDYDAGTLQPGDAAAILSYMGIRAIIYTSASHTPTAPRWRVLAPFSHDLPPSARRDTVARINAALGGVLAGESFTLSQSFFVGRVQGAVYECHTSLGQCIDTLVNLPMEYPVLAGRSATSVAHTDRTDANIPELQSALRVIPADDRDTWIAVGQSLCGLGDVGFMLWAEWSATSPKHDPDCDYSTWETFTGNRTGFASVFAKAQALGWENPRARKPLDTSAIGFGKTSLASHRAPCARTIDGSRLVMAHEADKIFTGCVYVRSLNRVLVPGGDLLDATTFNRMYQKYSFMIDAGNTVKAKTPIDALLGNQVMDFDIVHDICFRPELPPATIISEAGRTLVNIWWPVETLRTPGDVTPFLDHMKRLLPVKTDHDQVMAYLAAVVQYPGNKFQWCPVVQGAEGNGKSFISECLEYAIGERYTHKPNASDIANKFTGWLRGKLFICVEEVMTEHKREVLDALKPLITNRRVEIQGKGSDQATGDNRANFLMFTNHKSAIPASVDKRRYAIYFSGQQSAADIARDGMGGRYFPNLYTWARSGGLAHIADYLATYAIPDELNPATLCQRAPHTSSTAEAIHESLGGLEQDILECIESGEVGFRDGWVSTTMLARKFEKRNVTAKRLVLALTTLGYVKHPGLHDGRCNNPIAMPDGNRPRLYVTAEHASLKVDCQGEIARLYAVAQSQFGLS